MGRESANKGDPTAEERRPIGHDLRGGETDLNSSVVHLYRGEIQRMRYWRERLDRTTYWAIVVMSAILPWTFSSNDNPATSCWWE